MSRWFRWYDGTTEDGKFRVVARMSRVTVRDAIALWCFILENASNLDHRGVCNRNEDFMASILDFDDGVVEEILSAMESVGMISVGHGAITICNWGKRQFESDTDPTAAKRQAAKRARDRSVSNEVVTRDSRSPDTDTDTDTDTEVEIEKNNLTVVPKKTKGPQKLGARLPEDFLPDGSCKRLAEELLLTVMEGRHALDNFLDYWRSVPGGKGLKLDWQATFRNWLREFARRKNPNGKAQKPNSIADGFAKVRAVIAEAERREHEGGGTVGEGDPFELS